MVKPASPESQEQRCPSCGAAFRLADRRKRVQCPHCKEVVDIAPEKPPARAAAPSAPAISAKELAEMKARLARIDELEARVASLEEKLAKLATARAPVAGPPPVASSGESGISLISSSSSPLVPPPIVEEKEEPAPKLIWHEPRLRDLAAAADEMPGEQHDALVANLAAIGSRRVMIQAAAEDPGATLRASRLHAIFEEARWTAPPVVAAPERLCTHPLSLVAQAGSTPHEMAALFMALSAAGLQPVSQIDPTFTGRDPILCVGAQG